MTAPELDPKKRILQAAIELLNEQEPETITVRQIAERAQVGVRLRSTTTFRPRTICSTKRSVVP